MDAKASMVNINVICCTLNKVSIKYKLKEKFIYFNCGVARDKRQKKEKKEKFFKKYFLLQKEKYFFVFFSLNETNAGSFDE